MDTVTDKPFSFGVPLEPAIETILTSDEVERKIAESEPDAPKKRGRKAGSTNAKKAEKEVETPAYVKAMFKPVIIGIHNGILKLLKLSVMDSEQEKMTVDGYSMMLNKRIPNIIEKHGDIIAAVGATAFVFMGKIASETNILNFGSKTKEPIKEKINNETSEQYNNDTWPEGKREN